MRQEGRLSQWDDSKGYGFITPKAGGARLFVHIKAFALSAGRPQAGEAVSYEPGVDAQGKQRALKVRRLEPAAVKADRAPSPSPSPAPRGQPGQPGQRGQRGGGGGAHLWLVPAFAAYYLAVDLAWPVPRAVWGVYMALSVASFIIYWDDKRSARRKQARVPENTLHLLALACGWPGAMLARQLLRHKSVKPAFTRIFWGTVALNWLGFTLAFTPLGQALLAVAAA